jgi:hypothetical protein
MAHARKAAAAIPTGSPVVARAKSGTVGQRHNFGGDGILATTQRRTQEALSPVKASTIDHSSHLAGDAWMLAATRKFEEGEKGINGITSVWNKFSSENGKLKDGTQGHQVLEDYMTQSALTCKKATTKAPSAHVGVKPDINLQSVENAHSLLAMKHRTPNARENYQGVKPTRPPDDYLLTELKTKHEAIEQKEAFAAAENNKARPYIFQDDYMITHSKYALDHIPTTPLKYAEAAKSTPHVAPESYELIYANANKAMTPDTDKYQGRTAHIDNTSFLASAARKAAQLTPSYRSRETAKGTPTKGVREVTI